MIKIIYLEITKYALYAAFEVTVLVISIVSPLFILLKKHKWFINVNIRI